MFMQLFSTFYALDVTLELLFLFILDGREVCSLFDFSFGFFFVLQFIFAFSLYCCILHKHLCLKFLEMYNDSLDALFLGAPTFKGRKQIENRRVVELGGKVISHFLNLHLFWLETLSSQCLCHLKNSPLRSIAHH